MSYFNDTPSPVAVEWCASPDHYDANGTHSGTGCHCKRHTISPDGVLSFSAADNKAHIIESCLTGLTDNTKETSV